ncbi:carbohydrate ABC transporter permease, partial [Labrys wisconsinensis]|nr:ABC-type sugar transport system permease subunit [Labrys wisconsinensis]
MSGAVSLASAGKGPRHDGGGAAVPPLASVIGRLRLADALVAYALAGPAFLLLVLLFFLPVVAVIVIALTDWQFGARTLAFVGLANFREVFADEGFRASLVNTLVYVLIVVPGTVVLGLIIALLIESGKSCRAFYRAIHFLPFMATLAAMA